MNRRDLLTKGVGLTTLSFCGCLGKDYEYLEINVFNHVEEDRRAKYTLYSNDELLVEEKVHVPASKIDGEYFNHEAKLRLGKEFQETI